jgi:hypothetical protein
MNSKPHDARDRERQHQREATKQQRPQVSPQQQVESAQRMLDTLRAERKRIAARAAELAESCKRTAFAAHGLRDAEASRELSSMRAESLNAEQLLREHDSAIGEAEQRLQAAHQVQASEARKAQIREQQQRSREFRQLGGYIDLHLDHVRRGLLALAENAHVVNKDHRFVFATHRILSVALAGTPFREAFPVADSGDKRSFPSFNHVVGQWCDSFDANLARELEMLDGQKATEAA